MNSTGAQNMIMIGPCLGHAWACPALPCPALLLGCFALFCCLAVVPCPVAWLPCPVAWLPCPALPCCLAALPYPVLPWTVCLPYPVAWLPCPALPCSALPCPACPTLSCPGLSALPCPALPWPGLPCLLCLALVCLPTLPSLVPCPALLINLSNALPVLMSDRFKGLRPCANPRGQWQEPAQHGIQQGTWGHGWGSYARNLRALEMCCGVCTMQCMT